MKQPKISCICPTRGRFNILRESISFFLLQDYENKELIIFNNHPIDIKIHPKLLKHNIKVINAGDYSGKSMQIIYSDALKYISEDSEYVAIWDDDDMYLPWHLSDNINKLLNSDKKFIRPKFGYWHDITHSTEYSVISNTLEAGMIVRKDIIFFDESVGNDSTGYTHPHIYWESKASKENNFIYNYDITAIFRWKYGQNDYHLQCSGPHNNIDSGENCILKPIGVKHRFFDFLEKVSLITIDNKVMKINNASKSMLFKKILDCNIDKFEHIDKYKVWLYWHDENIPIFLKLCHDSIRYNTFAEVEVLNDNSILKFNLPNFINNYKATQRADYLRVYLLNTYGGWWFDSDTYVVGDLDEYYFRYITNNETVFPWESNVYGNVIMALLSSKPNSFIMRNTLDNLNIYLKDAPNVGWSGIGMNGVIKTINKYKDRGDWIMLGLNDVGTLGYNNSNINKWNFDRIVPTKLQMLVFHWSEVGLKLNINSNDIVEIVDNYPNLQKLLVLYKQNYIL